MNRLLLLTPDAGRYQTLLDEAALPGLQIIAGGQHDRIDEAWRQCNLVLGEPARVAAMLDRLPRLEWVQSTFAGVDALCRPGLRRDYTLTGLKGIFGPLMSEYVFAHILNRERQLQQLQAQQTAGEWRPLAYRGLSGLTLGVCGFGSIGRHLASTANHFGMRVVAYRRRPGEDALAQRVYSGDQLHAFLGEADYLVLVLPATGATDRLIDRAALAQMKRDAVLINVGRGSTVVEADLVDALRDGVIRAAVLDVFEQEPLAATSPLWTLPQVTLTPHSAAISFPQAVVGIFCDNYQRYRQQQPLRNPVDFTAGY